MKLIVYCFAFYWIVRMYDISPSSSMGEHLKKLDFVEGCQQLLY